jgi:hypothetical protein
MDLKLQINFENTNRKNRINIKYQKINSKDKASGKTGSEKESNIKDQKTNKKRAKKLKKCKGTVGQILKRCSVKFNPAERS